MNRNNSLSSYHKKNVTQLSNLMKVGVDRCCHLDQDPFAFGVVLQGLDFEFAFARPIFVPWKTKSQESIRYKATKIVTRLVWGLMHYCPRISNSCYFESLFGNSDIFFRFNTEICLLQFDDFFTALARFFMNLDDI